MAQRVVPDPAKRLQYLKQAGGFGPARLRKYRGTALAERDISSSARNIRSRSQRKARHSAELAANLLEEQRARHGERTRRRGSASGWITDSRRDRQRLGRPKKPRGNYRNSNRPGRWRNSAPPEKPKPIRRMHPGTPALSQVGGARWEGLKSRTRMSPRHVEAHRNARGKLARLGRVEGDRTINTFAMVSGVILRKSQSFLRAGDGDSRRVVRRRRRRVAIEYLFAKARPEILAAGR
jgi:hypothetical protein